MSKKGKRSKRKRKKEKATCPLPRKALLKKKKKKNELSMCKCTLAILSIKQPDFLPLVFSPFWRENFLVGSGRKRLNPIIYFPFSLSNQTHSKKVFLPIFSPKFSIHPISSLNKHTLKMTTFYSSQVHC